MENILNFIRGFCMALADSVPGVSGGTIAFLLGFYDDFINSLNSLIKGTKEERIAAIKFLIKIGIGWAVGFILAILILASVFESHIYNISSLFLGFVLFAIPLIIIEEKNEFRGRYKNIIFAILGIILVIAISAFNPSSGDTMNVSADHLNIGLIIYVFLAGAIAISAMVLPGISGSTLLLVFGLYMPIVNAIKEFLHLNFAYFPVLCVFGLGVITGIIAVIRLIQKALEKYRSQTLYAIIGLMIGSLYAIVLGPTTLEVPQPALTLKTFSLVFFFIGGVVILGLQRLKQISTKKEEEK